METLVDLMGGANTTEQRLDTMFIEGLKKSGVGSGQLNGVGSTFFNPVGLHPLFSSRLLIITLLREMSPASLPRSYIIIYRKGSTSLYCEVGRLSTFITATARLVFREILIQEH